ncbi:hypothetical protein LUZ60_004065 [Juncus effusus]|nr:hypothetical protein LUZ60_004065 [Juncus effusus]
MNWGMNTDFQAVFDRLLEVAVEGKLEPEKMIKRIFVFSDMEWHPVILGRQITKQFAVTSKQKGAALVSGFSKNLVKLFLKQDEKQMDPGVIMLAAISRKEYDKLAIYD